MTDFIKTPPFRMSWPNLFKQGRLSGKFDMTMLFPKGAPEALKPMVDLVIEAYTEKWKHKPDGLKLPWKDGDKQTKYPEQKGCIVATCKTDYKPSVVDHNAVNIEDSRNIIPGAWAWATLNAWPWEHQANGKGVSFGLAHVQLLPLSFVIDYYKKYPKVVYEITDNQFGSTGPSVEDMYSPIDGPEDDPAMYDNQDTPPSVDEVDDFMG